MIDEVMPGAEPVFQPGDAVVVQAGVLLLHDLAGTPQPFHGLTKALSAAGFTVDLPLLPGHGTQLDNLTAMTWDDWAGAAQLALDELASRTGQVVVGGIAMGATLACWVAAQHPQVVGVVAINPRAQPVPPEAIETLKAMLADGVVTVPPLAPDVSDHQARVLAYDTIPVATLLSMFDAIAGMADHWEEVQCPVLLVNSGRDHRVSPTNADWLVEHLRVPVERLTLEHSFHLATVDRESGELERAVLEFVRRVTTG